MPINGGESLQKAIIYGACEEREEKASVIVSLWDLDSAQMQKHFKAGEIEEKIINCSNGTKYLLCGG